MKKGISLIALIITIAVLVIIAGAAIQKGIQRADDAKLAKHNTNISTTQEEIESYYYYKEGNLPVVNLTPYPITSNPTLLAEITKNGEDTDEFYVVDLSKLGKVAGKDGTGLGDDIYIVSSKKHTVYYAKGSIIKGLVYHGLGIKNSGSIVQAGGTSPTGSATATPTVISTPTPTTAPSHAYNNPIVPAGFTHVGGQNWENGFTIQDASGNQFVWVPALDPRVQANGTLDGTTFTSKFGRRKFKGETFDASNFYETNDTALQNMTASVGKYGGFYIAKYEASDNGSGKGQSKANMYPWVIINWHTSKAKAEAMDTDWGWNTSAVESYLCYDAHWDTTLQWLIDSGTKPLSEVANDSTSWGNYNNATFTYGAGLTKDLDTTALINTGVSTEPANRHMAKGIYDLAGNVWEWTMGNYTSSWRVFRGGHCDNNGNTAAAMRAPNDPNYQYSGLGWRAVLCVY